MEPILERVAPAELVIRGDGRTVYGIAVPFDREATVNDGFGAYREVFRMGAFKKTIRENGARVKFLANHKRDMPIGKAVSLREDPEGLIGEFRVSNTPEGNNALELIRDGVYDSFSIGFAKVPGKDRDKDGLTERLEVKLREVSILAFPAYEGALVAGVRQQFTDEELERFIAIAKDLSTQRAEAADDGTSTQEPESPPTEPELGHSIGTPTHSQLRAAIRLRGLLL